MDIFWNYTLKKHNGGDQKLFSAVRYGTNVSISVHTTGIFYTQPNKGSRIPRVNSVSGRAPRQSGTQKRTDNLKWVRGGRFKVKISRLKPTCI